MQNLMIAFLIVFFTILIYLAMMRIYSFFRLPFLLPVITATFFIIVFLLFFHVDYSTYMIGGKWINYLLGPVVVSLAYPLYKQRAVLLRNFLPILSGVFIGVNVGMVSGMMLAKLLGFSKEIILSVVPKSITMPVAMDITSKIGGISSLTAIFVMTGGLSGVIFGPIILKLFRIKSYVGRGISLGTSSHAIGLAKAIEYGEDALSISSVALTVCAITASVLGPIIVWVFYH